MSETGDDETDAGTEGEEEEKVPVTWEGEVKEGWIPDKIGTAAFPNGDIYVGNYENGKKNGYGKYTWVKGGVYEGLYSNDERNGTGVMKYPDKSVYSGAWLRSKRHGEGVYTYINGDRYQGEWREDLRHGHGSYYFVESMSLFIGTWELGRFISGDWAWRDGNIYQGTFFEDQPIGYGKYKFRATNNELEGLYVRSELPPDLSKVPSNQKKKSKRGKKPPPPTPIINLDFKCAELRTRSLKQGYY